MELNTTETITVLYYNYTHNNETDTMPIEPRLPEYITIYVTVINIIIFVVGIVGNSLVIAVVARVKDMRTTMNLYLVNLSAADFLLLLVCQPTAMLDFYAKERWILGDGACTYTHPIDVNY